MRLVPPLDSIAGTKHYMRTHVAVNIMSRLGDLQTHTLANTHALVKTTVLFRQTQQLIMAKTKRTRSGAGLVTEMKMTHTSSFWVMTVRMMCSLWLSGEGLSWWLIGQQQD